MMEQYHFRKWYKDLDSTVFMWVRWILIISQIGFSTIIVITENTTIAIIGYCLAVLPPLIFVTVECFVPWFDTDYKYSLHAPFWVISRCLVLVVSLILLYLWIELHIPWLLVIVWVMSEALLLFENMFVVDTYDKCCCCQFYSEYQTL